MKRILTGLSLACPWGQSNPPALAAGERAWRFERLQDLAARRPEECVCGGTALAPDHHLQKKCVDAVRAASRRWSRSKTESADCRRLRLARDGNRGRPRCKRQGRAGLGPSRQLLRACLRGADLGL